VRTRPTHLVCLYRHCLTVIFWSQLSNSRAFVVGLNWLTVFCQPSSRLQAVIMLARWAIAYPLATYEQRLLHSAKTPSYPQCIARSQHDRKFSLLKNTETASNSPTRWPPPQPDVICARCTMGRDFARQALADCRKLIQCLFAVTGAVCAHRIHFRPATNCMRALRLSVHWQFCFDESELLSELLAAPTERDD